MEIDPLHGWQAGDLAEPGDQRVASMELIGAVRDDDRTRPAAIPDQVADQVERCGVRPVEIFEDDDERPIGAKTRDQRANGTEHPSRDEVFGHGDGDRVGESSGEARMDPREVGADVPHGLRELAIVHATDQRVDGRHDRRVRQRRVDRRATADGHPGTLAIHVPRELLDQA